MSSRNRSKRNKRKNNVRRRRNTSDMSSNMRSTNPRTYIYGDTKIIRGPTPDSVLVDLYFQDTTFTRNNAGSTICSWRYRINSAFDPDPLLGSGSLSGFVEWSLMYTHYRVVEFGYDVQISNQESFPMIVLCAPSLPDVGANYPSVDQLSEFPYGRKNIISAKTGNDRCRFKGKVDIARLEGTKEAIYDSTFASQVTTNPAQLRFFNVGFSGGTNILVNGVMNSSRFMYRTLFFARLPIPG
jgi:hypothetical protein